MNRFGAFLVHLGICAAVLAVILYFVFFWWYPGFFFDSDGGGQGLRLVLLVDLVLGPVLTLVVFDRRKPELKRDLTIIGTLQAVCLAAGVYVVWSERPLALVFVDGYFFSVSRDDLASEPALEALPGSYPKQVYVKLPADPIEQSKIRSEAWRSGTPLRVKQELYAPYAQLQDKFAEAFDLELLRANDPNDALARWEAEHGAADDFAFFPFGARYGFNFIGVSEPDGRIVGLLEIPFEGAQSE